MTVCNMLISEPLAVILWMDKIQVSSLSPNTRASSIPPDQVFGFKLESLQKFQSLAPLPFELTLE